MKWKRTMDDALWREMKTVGETLRRGRERRKKKQEDNKNENQRGGMRDRESGQGGRQAYHLCVGGHKLRKNREEEEKKGCKINREEAERGREGGGEKRESGQK